MRCPNPKCGELLEPPAPPEDYTVTRCTKFFVCVTCSSTLQLSAVRDDVFHWLPWKCPLWRDPRGSWVAGPDATPTPPKKRGYR